MLLKKYSIIFVHQRKCAGSAIKFALSELGQINSVLQDGLCDKDWKTYQSHLNRYFKFCVIRNPWDRFVSSWKYLTAYQDLDVRSILEKLPEKKAKSSQERHDYRHLSQLQSDLIFDQSERCVLDKTIRFENLDNGFSKMLTERGLPPLRLKIENRTVKPDIDYRDIFEGRECRELFASKFARDISLLGYRFEDGPGKNPGESNGSAQRHR